MPSELGVAVVDIRRQDFDALRWPSTSTYGALGVLDEVDQFIGVVGLDRHQRGEELDRVVGLEVGRLVGDQGVAEGVGLVERVPGERLDQVEDVLRPFRRPRRPWPPRPP